MRDSTLAEVAQVVAKDSKCVSLQVGCVLVKDGRIVSTGVNGTPRGWVNCCEVWEGQSLEHSEWSQKFEIHAEMNAIGNCREGVAGSRAFVTHSPCFNCAKHMVAMGVTEIIYQTAYHRYTASDIEEIRSYCNDNNVVYRQEEVSG